MRVLNSALSGSLVSVLKPHHPKPPTVCISAGRRRSPKSPADKFYLRPRSEPTRFLNVISETHTLCVSLVMINIDLFDITILRCQWLYLRMNTANLFTSRPWPIAPFFSICKFYRISRAKFGHEIPTPVLFTDDRAFLCAKCTLVKNWSLPRIEAWLRGDGATLSWLRDSIDQQGMTKACTVRFLSE